MKEPYADINPTKQIPYMQEVDSNTGEVFNLGESHTILRYLADSRGCPDHWYPSDLRERAKVDAYLDQHHTYLRLGVGGYIFRKLFSKTLLGITYEEKDLEFFKIMLKRSLRLIETRLTEHKYLCSDQVSIADFSAACELD